MMRCFVSKRQWFPRRISILYYIWANNGEIEINNPEGGDKESEDWQFGVCSLSEFIPSDKH